jgi:hypothetical protein
MATAQKLPSWLTGIVIALASGSASGGGVYATMRAETAHNAEQIAEIKTDMRGIQRALGSVQFDMAVVCAEIVRARGGNPMNECRTSGGRGIR